MVMRQKAARDLERVTGSASLEEVLRPKKKTDLDKAMAQLRIANETIGPIKPTPKPKKKPSWIAQAIMGKRYKMSRAADKAQRELGKEPTLGYADTARKLARDEVIRGLMKSGLTREEAEKKSGIK